MGTKFFYAVILTICSIVLQLLLFFTGFQTEKLATGQYLAYVGFAIMAVVLWLGIQAVRDERPDHTLTYGQGVGAGVLISLYSGLMNAVYTYIHLKFINTGFADHMMDTIRTKWAARGMTEAQMETAEGFTRTMIGPGAQAIMAPFITVLVGLVLSLIISALIKRKTPTIAESAPPAS
jgi:hypothetical protein